MEERLAAIDRAETLRMRLWTVFGEPKASRFAHLPVIGCCAEHEAGFGWYRDHHWAELPQAAVGGLLDPYEISSLHDEVYYAFVPGLCLHALDLIAGWYEKQHFSRARIDDFIDPGLLFGRKDLRVSVERHLSFAQYRCVKAVLYFYDDCLRDIEGHAVTIEGPGGFRAFREWIERQWDDWSLYHRADGSLPLEAEEIVARSYDVFAGYRFSGAVEACPECLPDDLNRLLVSTPLRGLSEPLLNAYCGAVHLQGPLKPDLVRQFKHFLPRMLELCLAGEWPAPYHEGYQLLVRIYQVLSAEAGRSEPEPGRLDDERTCFYDFARLAIDTRMNQKPDTGYAVADLFDFLQCEATFGLAKSHVGRRLDRYIFRHPAPNALWHIAHYVAAYVGTVPSSVPEHVPVDVHHVFNTFDRSEMERLADRLMQAVTDTEVILPAERRQVFEVALDRLMQSM